MKKIDKRIFVTIIKYELKKLLINRVTVIALLVSICLLAGVSLIEYVIISPEDRYVAKREGVIEGRELDGRMIDEIVDTALPFGSLTEIPGDNAYSHVAGYMNRALGAYMNIEGIGGKYSLSKLTEEQFYKTREDILDYLYDYFGLNDAEKGYWASMEGQILKPFVWKTNYGLYSMRANISASITLTIFMIGICLSGVFAAEASHRTEGMILSTRAGRGIIASAKLIAGGLFSGTVGGILFIAVNIPHVIFNGLDGWDTVCQLIVPFTSYPYTSGELVLVCFGIYMIAALLIGSLVMLLSCILKNMAATAGMICTAVCVDLFFTVPPQFRVLSQVRYLTPVQVLINSSMTDPRLVQIGGYFLTQFQVAGIVYAVLMCVFLWLSHFIYADR